MTVGVERVKTQSGNGVLPVGIALQIDRVGLPFAVAVIGL